MPVPHHSIFKGRMPFLPPNKQRQSRNLPSVFKWTLIDNTCNTKLWDLLIHGCSLCDKQTLHLVPPRFQTMSRQLSGILCQQPSKLHQYFCNICQTLKGLHNFLHGLVHLRNFCLTNMHVSSRRRKMYCGHARLCVSVRSRISTLSHGPGCNLGSGRGCPLVVHYWADLQSVHGMRCYGNIMEMRGRAQR